MATCRDPARPHHRHRPAAPRRPTASHGGRKHLYALQSTALSHMWISWLAQAGRGSRLQLCRFARAATADHLRQGTRWKICSLREKNGASGVRVRLLTRLLIWATHRLNFISGLDLTFAAPLAQALLRLPAAGTLPPGSRAGCTRTRRGSRGRRKCMAPRAPSRDLGSSGRDDETLAARGSATARGAAPPLNIFGP